MKLKKKIALLVVSALLSAGSLVSFLIYGTYRWALWRAAHPGSGTAYAVSVIGGADGPTAVFVTVGGPMEFYLAAGAALLAGGLGLLLWARKMGSKE